MREDIPGGSDKESAFNARYLGLISGQEVISKGHGNPLQCLSLENPMDRGA